MGYRLIKVTDKQDWLLYHEIRRTILFEDRGRIGIYNENHPDEFDPNNHPLLLKFNDYAYGTTRLDDRKDGAGIVRQVAIIESEQGKGHGRVLSQLVDEYARSLNMAVLFVNAAPEAVGYYECTGWISFLWDKSELADISVGCVQMKKHLSLS